MNTAIRHGGEICPRSFGGHYHEHPFRWRNSEWRSCYENSLAFEIPTNATRGEIQSPDPLGRFPCGRAPAAKPGTGLSCAGFIHTGFWLACINIHVSCFHCRESSGGTTVNMQATSGRWSVSPAKGWDWVSVARLLSYKVSGNLSFAFSICWLRFKWNVAKEVKEPQELIHRKVSVWILSYLFWKCQERVRRKPGCY